MQTSTYAARLAYFALGAIDAAASAYVDQDDPPKEKISIRVWICSGSLLNWPSGTNACIHAYLWLLILVQCNTMIPISLSNYACFLVQQSLHYQNATGHCHSMYNSCVNNMTKNWLPSICVLIVFCLLVGLGFTKFCCSVKIRGKCSNFEYYCRRHRDTSTKVHVTRYTQTKHMPFVLEDSKLCQQHTKLCRLVASWLISSLYSLPFSVECSLCNLWFILLFV